MLLEGFISPEITDSCDPRLTTWGQQHLGVDRGPSFIHSVLVSRSRYSTEVSVPARSPVPPPTTNTENTDAFLKYKKRIKYNAVVRLYHRFVAVFYNYFRLMEHDWLPGGILLHRRCSEFVTPCGIVGKLTFQTAKSSLVRPTIVSSVLPFYYICRFWRLRHRRFGLTPYSRYWLPWGLPSAP